MAPAINSAGGQCFDMMELNSAADLFAAVYQWHN